MLCHDIDSSIGLDADCSLVFNDDFFSTDAVIQLSAVCFDCGNDGGNAVDAAGSEHVSRTKSHAVSVVLENHGYPKINHGVYGIARVRQAVAQ